MENIEEKDERIDLDDCYRAGAVCCFTDSSQEKCKKIFGEDHVFPDWPSPGDGIIKRPQFPKIFRDQAAARRKALKDACKDCGCKVASLTHICDDDTTRGIKQLVQAGRMPFNWCLWTLHMDCANGQYSVTPNCRRLPRQPAKRNWQPLPPGWPRNPPPPRPF